MKHVPGILACLLFVCSSGCETGSIKTPYVNVTPGWIENVAVEPSAGALENPASIRIYIPKSCTTGEKIRTLLLLSGNRTDARDWPANTDIVQQAEINTFVLVFVTLKDSIYETRYYPETTLRWGAAPGGKWICETLIPYLRKTYALACDRSSVGVLGISTGARGALLIAATYPQIFGAAAGISGYYDNLSLTESKLLTPHYGRYDDFKERWEKNDNVIELAAKCDSTPIFLAHAIRDTEIPVEQSRLMSIRLRQLQKKKPGSYVFEYHESEYYYAHTWRYWKTLTPLIMKFFNNHLK